MIAVKNDFIFHESGEFILQQKKLLELENRIHFRIIHYSKIKPPRK